MIDAEKLLGGLIRQSLSGGRGRRRRRSRGLGSLLGPGLAGAAGLGALGVAIAAFEHFAGKGQGSPPPGQAPMNPAVPPPPGAPGTARPVPPPPGALPGAASAPEAVTSAVAPQVNQSEALLLVQAMLAAANADGHIDAQERSAILEYLEEGQLTSEERDFILKALAEPPTIDSLLPRIQSTELAEQVYAVSLLAVEVDTRAERDYLGYLRIRLGLDEETVTRIEANLADGSDGL